MTPLSKETVTAILARTRLFAEFGPEELVAFIENMEVVQLAEGAVVFEESSPGDAWYVVISGEASVQRSMLSGPPHTINTLERGDSFGEMALLESAERMASIVAITDLTLARLPRDLFDDLVESGDAAATKLLLGMARELSKRQRQLTWLLQDLVDFEEPGPEDQALLEALGQAMPGS